MGLTTFKQEQLGENRWRQRDMQGYVFVFDTGGNLLCQRRVGESVELLAIMQAKHSTDHPTILVGSRQTLRRFSFSPDQQKR